MLAVTLVTVLADLVSVVVKLCVSVCVEVTPRSVVREEVLVKVVVLDVVAVSVCVAVTSTVEVTVSSATTVAKPKSDEQKAALTIAPPGTLDDEIEELDVEDPDTVRLNELELDAVVLAMVVFGNNIEDIVFPDIEFPGATTAPPFALDVGDMVRVAVTVLVTVVN